MNLRTATLLAVLPLVGFVLSAPVQGQDMDEIGLPDGFGVHMPNGSKVSTFLSFGEDVDDYVFEGFPGQKLTATLKMSKGTDVNGGLILKRPDGTEVDEADGAKVKRGDPITVVVEEVVFNPATGEDEITLVNTQVEPIEQIKFTLDQVGVWKVRVDVLDDFVAPGDDGEYSLKVKYGKPPKVKVKEQQTNENRQIVFDVPADGGATLNFAFNFKGTNVNFNGLFEPDGTLIDKQFNEQGEQSPLLDKIKSNPGKKISGKKIVLPADGDLGNYRVVFDLPGALLLTKSKFNAKVKLGDGAGKRKGKLDNNEPIIGGTINPDEGGPGTDVTIQVVNAFDEYDQNGQPVVKIGGVALEITNISEAPGATLITARIPAAFREGAYPVVVETSTGQLDVIVDGFERVPPPVAFDIDPRVGPDAGGIECTITGANFVPGQMGVILEGALLPLVPTEVTENELTFTAPGRAPGFYTYGVINTFTQLRSNLQVGSFQYLSSPGISRIVPGLVSVLGGDTIFVKGTYFESTDELWMETATPGVFEEITATLTTFKHSELHSFPAPIRPKGTYEIYLVDDQGIRTGGTRTIDYFTFSALPTTTNLGDAWSTAIADYDQDDDLDLFLASRGGASKSTTALIELFQNDGAGNFTNVSSTVIPAPSATDDWRADSIHLVDANQDGFPDIFIATASDVVPTPTSSHVRILISERRSSQVPVGDRVFRDKTLALMPPPRPGKSGVSNTSGDNWRALDMWVGDIDRGPTGPPEVLITGKNLFEEIDVQCGNYCSSNIGGALYRFYWGGSRQFFWDSTRRSGQGAYRFDPNFFPRKSGVLVPIGNPPPGVTIPSCNTSTPCKGLFTPFTGHTITVGELNNDGKPDVVVVNDQTVTRDGTAISSTQVAINIFSAATGSAITDVTAKLTDLLGAGASKFDHALIGQFGYPDGNSFGTLVLSHNSAVTSPALKLLQFVPSAVEGEVAEFEDITAFVLPSVLANDKWQASAMAEIDVDADGDRDLILVANTAPGTGESAFRILRNSVVNLQGGIFQEDFAGLIDPIIGVTGDAYDGTSLLLGDIDNNGALDFIVTRSVIQGVGSQTRMLSIDK